MRLPLISLLVSFLFTGAASAQSGGGAHFTIVQASDGKTVGATQCAFVPVTSGYQVTSSGQVKLARFSYSFTNENHLDTELNIIRDQLSGTVNGAKVTFTMASDPSGRQFQVNIDAAGKPAVTNSFDRHQHLVLLPDLDAAAYVEMVHFALEHPQTTWVVIPKQNGLLVPAEYDSQPDLGGNWNGQPVTVHHTTVTISAQNAISAEIYYTSDGALLEADLPEQNFYVIRDQFQLQNRPHYTPPQNPAPSAQQPDQPPDQQPDQQQPQ